jgi:hypothetical protein
VDVLSFSTAVEIATARGASRIISPGSPAGFPALTIRQDDRKAEARRRRQCQLAQVASLIESQSGGLRVRVVEAVDEKCLARKNGQGIGVAERVVLSNHDHFFGLFALWPLHQFVFHFLSFIQSLEAVHLDRGVMDENVPTAFRLLDKAEAFGGVEPFDFA